MVEVGEWELCSICGQLHREAAVDAVGALPVHKSNALGVSGGKHGGDLKTSDESKERRNLNSVRISTGFKRVKTESRPYDVSVQGRAGALLSDSHAEARQAAIFVGRVEVEGARLAAGAWRTLHVHLHIENTQRDIKAPLLAAYKRGHEKVPWRCSDKFGYMPCSGRSRWSCSLRFLAGRSFGISLQTGNLCSEPQHKTNTQDFTVLIHSWPFLNTLFELSQMVKFTGSKRESKKAASKANRVLMFI